MVAFLLPDRCLRCKKKVKRPEKELFQVSLPTQHSKRQKKKIIFAYTPMIYLCKECVGELNKWIIEKNRKDVSKMKKVLQWIILIWSILAVPYALFSEPNAYDTFLQLLYLGSVIGLMISDLKEAEKKK